jgi:hypothetical protein
LLTWMVLDFTMIIYVCCPVFNATPPSTPAFILHCSHFTSCEYR